MDFEFAPGDVMLRPMRITACAPRTMLMREAERELQLTALVAAQVDARAPLTCDMLLRDAPHQLRVPGDAIKIKRLGQGLFLLQFGCMEQRNTVHARRRFQCGEAVLHLRPWGRHFQASDGSLHRGLRYHARVCIEGVPDHAHQGEAVSQLFAPPAFVDKVDCVVEKEAERSCFTVWVWMAAPSDLARSGTLKIVEPVLPPEDQYDGDGSMEWQQLRERPIKTLDYQVLIHLDRVLDYTAPPRSTSQQSYASDISGIPPDADPLPECPETYRFDWYLGVPDGEPAPAHGHAGHSEGRRRERSPPPRGGGGGGGFRQAPPPNKHDVARSSVFGRLGPASGASGGSSIYSGGRRYTAREVQEGRTKQVWSRRQEEGEPMRKGDSMLFRSPDDSFLVGETQWSDHRMADPMQEEAIRAPCPRQLRSARPQRSVEPTVAMADLAMPNNKEGDKGVLVNTSAVEPSVVQGQAKHARQSNMTTTAVDACLEEHMASAEAAKGAEREVTPPRELEDLEESRQAAMAVAVTASLLAAQDVAEEDDLAGIELGGGPEETQVYADGPDAGPEAGLLFDLNIECVEHPLDGLISNGLAQEKMTPGRHVLGHAEGRLNKEVGERAGHKSSPRGLARLTIPLRKSLLCNPSPRPKAPAMKKQATAEPGKRTTKGSGINPSVTIDDQATEFLLKATGNIIQDNESTDQKQQRLGEQFVSTIQENTVEDMRTAFGLPAIGGVDVLSPLFLEVADGYDA
ncbi:unnamed protein product [Urochloa decumbens]|uniref:Uncharacterized protein n=1 Tax=Urochloa decumbens TaxID=240449 RepID=A0ABC9ENZ1_9POAL